MTVHDTSLPQGMAYRPTLTPFSHPPLSVIPINDCPRRLSTSEDGLSLDLNPFFTSTANELSVPYPGYALGKRSTPLNF